MIAPDPDPEAPTTAAMHTPPGRGGIAVIVLSGPRAGEILARAFRPLASHATGGQGVLQLGRLLDGDRMVDEAILTWRGPRQAEIGIHGGPAVTAAAMDLLRRLGAMDSEMPLRAHYEPDATTKSPPSPSAVAALPTAWPALDNPAIGEELLAALRHAQSAWVVGVLSRQWSGGLSELVRRAVEAIGDGGRTARSVPVRASEDQRLTASLRAAALRLAPIRRLLDPAEVVLAGPPNVGKSTLANALIGRQVSLVHDQAGTTRDWVREPAILCGVPVHVTDTAGLWEAPADVDAQAVGRARQRIEQADVVLLLGAGRPTPPPAWLAGSRRIVHVATKIDVLPPFAGADAAVCAVTGDGLDALARRIVEALGLGPSDFDPAAPAAFTQRQADLLALAAAAIENGRPDEARRCLREILGERR